MIACARDLSAYVDVARVWDVCVYSGHLSNEICNRYDNLLSESVRVRNYVLLSNPVHVYGGRDWRVHTDLALVRNRGLHVTMLAFGVRGNTCTLIAVTCVHGSCVLQRIAISVLPGGERGR